MIMKIQIKVESWNKIFKCVMGTFYWMLRIKNFLWIIQYQWYWLNEWHFECFAMHFQNGGSTWPLYILHICWSIITKKYWNTHQLLYMGLHLRKIICYEGLGHNQIDRAIIMNRSKTSQVAMFDLWCMLYTFPSTKKIKSIFISARFGDCEDTYIFF